MDIWLLEHLRNLLDPIAFWIVAPFWSSLYFWLPSLAFLAAFLHFRTPRHTGLNLFFGLSAFALAHQLGFLLQIWIQRLAPFAWKAIDQGTGRPENYANEMIFSLPDGGTAAFAAVLTFIALRLRPREYWVLPLAGIILACLGTGRVYHGLAYPTDFLAGLAFGMLTGAFVATVAKNVERILKPVE